MYTQHIFAPPPSSFSRTALAHARCSAATITSKIDSDRERANAMEKAFRARGVCVVHFMQTHRPVDTGSKLA